MSETIDFTQIQAANKIAYENALTSTREFTFTSIKTFDGREGEGYSATVTRNGAKVGSVTDEGNGGAPFLSLMPDDRKAFIAEGASFYPESYKPNDDEAYCLILAFAAQINRKRKSIVSTDDNDLSDGFFFEMSGGNGDLVALARYLVSEKSGMASQNPKIWIKSEGRFVPAKDLIG